MPCRNVATISDDETGAPVSIGCVNDSVRARSIRAAASGVMRRPACSDSNIAVSTTLSVSGRRAARSWNAGPREETIAQTSTTRRCNSSVAATRRSSNGAAGSISPNARSSGA